MNLQSFVDGLRQASVGVAVEDAITVKWVDSTGRIVATHTADGTEPIDYRLGLHGGDDDDITVELSYRGQPVYRMRKVFWDALDPDDLSTVPTDVLQGIVEGCEKVQRVQRGEE
jgi:hypothetical protein